MKLAIVTGASKGIGESIVQKFLNDSNWLVIGISRSQINQSIKTSNFIELLADLSDPKPLEQLKALINKAKTKYIIEEISFIHNFGFTQNIPITEISDDVWQKTIWANLTLPFVSTREITSLMPTGSSHLYIGSTLSLIAVRDSSAYVAAKHGLAGLMKSAAIDLAPKGIRANLICPGFTDTQMADQVLEYSAQAKGMSLSDFKKIMEAQSPLNRFLHPSEIADLVFYIANQKAINGEILSINGGFGLMS